MEGKVYKASLLNSYADTDIVTDTSVIPSLYEIPGLMPISAADFKGVTEHAPTAEVRQVYTIGYAVAPTVVANTKYTVIIGNTDNTREGAHLQLARINYVSPANLTGTASLDRDNLYHALAARINSNQSLYATAYPLFTITQTNTSAFAVGEIVTQAGTNATAINVSGTTGTLTLGYISGTWSTASHALTGSITGAASATAATIVVGLGLRIVDDAGYYPANGGRQGANEVVLPSFPAAWVSPSTQLVQTTAPVYSFGQGTRMQQDVPVRERTSPNLASGTWEMATNNAPVTGATYQQFVFVDTPAAYSGELGQTAGTAQRVQVLWLEKTTDGSTPVSTYAATRTAILALNP
jgi:hypothetical protein